MNNSVVQDGLCGGLIEKKIALLGPFQDPKRVGLKSNNRIVSS
jgi:hypothetical protein